MKNEEQEEKIRANWVISLENGKLTRIMFGNQNREDLKKREGCKAILTNVPNTAQEALLLRAIRFTGAKSVYIPYNSNRNPSHIAKVFFESEEDKKRAINRSINYYNTRLYWKENLVPHPKRYEEKWSSGTKKKQSSNSSNAEIEGKSKGDYWQLKKIKEKVKREQTKVHEEKKE